MKFIWLMLFGFLYVFSPPLVHAQMKVLSGSYTGNGVDNRAITGLCFQPDVVFIKGTNNVNTNEAAVTVCRTSTMSGDATKSLGSNSLPLQSNWIQSLDANGFTVGTHTAVNASGAGWNYYWVAFKAAAGEMVVGSYTGNGTDNRNITGVGFQPDYVIVMAAANQVAVHRSSALPGTFSNGTSTINTGNLTTDRCYTFTAESSFRNGIQQIQSDGFQVGTHARVNSSGVTYHYIAWKKIAGSMNVGAYAGNGIDNRDITGVGFQPEWVIVKSNSTQASNNDPAVHHPESLGATTDLTLQFPFSASFGNGIQKLISDGFQVGNDIKVNGSVVERYYFWAAFREFTCVTAVTLASFMAEADGDRNVTLSWETAAEVDNAGFNLYRARSRDGHYIRVNDILIPAKGGATSEASYRYMDTPPAYGTYYYKLEDVDYNGVSTMHGPEKVRVRK